MELDKIIADLKQDKLAARRFEKEGHSRYRDCVYVARNGRVLFERYCYGEAASLVFGLRAKTVEPDGQIVWESGGASYERPEEAPQKLTGYKSCAMLFDSKPALWSPAADLKTYKPARLGWLSMLFANLFGR